jgi:NADH:ubiquinone oxidoreductase subunit 4 (subunit M)
MRKFAIVPLLFMLTACASLGLPTAKTFNERAAVAYGTVTTVRETTASLLVAKKITASDAQNVQNQANTAREGIDLARSVVATNPGDADTKLTAAITVLSALQTYLEGKK